jgi:hypothetical protein
MHWRKAERLLLFQFVMSLIGGARHRDGAMFAWVAGYSRHRGASLLSTVPLASATGSNPAPGPLSVRGRALWWALHVVATHPRRILNPWGASA